MTRYEILEEVYGDMKWIEGVANGIRLKYRNEFSRYKPAGKTKVLEVAKYTTPTRKNKVWIVWVKEVMGGEWMTLSFYTFFERTTKEGKLEWVFATPSSIIILTQHCFDRLLERAGLGFKKVLQLVSNAGFLSYIEPYTYEGRKTYAIAFGDYGLFLCDIEDGIVTCKTFVSKDLLGEEQIEAQATSMECGVKKDNRLSNELLEMYLERKRKQNNYNRYPQPV